MPENIELWGYSNYENNIFELKLIASSQIKKTKNTTKQLSKVNYNEFFISDHLKNKNKQIQELFKTLQDKIFSLESDQKIEENPRQDYIAYRTNKNFVELKIQSRAIKIWIDLSKDELNDPQNLIRDMKNIGHHGTGNSEITFKSFDELDYIMGLIEQSYLQSI